MTREEYRRSVKSGGMYTTRDVYGNPRFIIHFLDLVHEDHPGDHCDKMESARRMANKHGGRRYRGRVFGGGGGCLPSVRTGFVDRRTLQRHL